jgi:uncharacterized protein YdeI (YjbR/CyaY-like superfamily)
VADDQEVLFFAEPGQWRRWLAENHADAQELWVGFHRKGSGLPSITWPQSVDEALCFGWIDGLRKSIDATSYKIRFTPRRRGSIWSAVNVRRVAELVERGLMQPAGRQAFAARREDRTAIYAHEREKAELSAEYEQRFRADAAAWAFWERQPPSYRNVLTRWVTGAKQAATRERRLATLIADSAAGIRSGSYQRPAGGTGADKPAP